MRVDADARLVLRRLRRCLQKRQEKDRGEPERHTPRAEGDQDGAHAPGNKHQLEYAVQRAERGHVQQRLRMAGENLQRERQHHHRAAPQ